MALGLLCADIPSVRIKLSVATAAPNFMSGTFADNRDSATEVTYYEGSATWSSPPGIDPAVFDLCFTPNDPNYPLGFAFKPWNNARILLDVEMLEGAIHPPDVNDNGTSVIIPCFDSYSVAAGWPAIVRPDYNGEAEGGDYLYALIARFKPCELILP